MKKISLVLLTVLINYHAFSQSTQGPPGDRKFMDGYSADKLVYFFQHEEIKGSPFLSDDWMKATIITRQNVVFTNVELKFDIYNNQFIYHRNDTNFRIGPDAAQITLYTNLGDSLVYKNGFDIDSHIKPGAYLQVLVQGNVTLLKHCRKDVEEYTEYGDATKYKKFLDICDYYILKDKQYNPTKISKKELESKLGDKWDKVNEWLSQNNVSVRDEKGFVAAVRYYNSL